MYGVTGFVGFYCEKSSSVVELMVKLENGGVRLGLFLWKGLGRGFCINRKSMVYRIR